MCTFSVSYVTQKCCCLPENEQLTRFIVFPYYTVNGQPNCNNLYQFVSSSTCINLHAHRWTGSFNSSTATSFNNWHHNMAYCIVNFKHENSVEVIPSTWLLDYEQCCHWPPFAGTRSAADVKSYEKPLLSWTVVQDVRAIHKYGL